jgi:ferritin-like protein
MSEYHESEDALPQAVKEQHRALQSLVEEVEAIDWYNQRVAVTTDVDLRQALIHNRDEEIEHAAMMIEWLRRKMDVWDDELGTYLFSDDPLGHAGDSAGDSTGDSTGDDGEQREDGSLGLGSLRS